MESTLPAPAYGLDPMIVGSSAAAARSRSLLRLTRTTRRRSATEMAGPASAAGGMTSRRRPKAETPVEAITAPPTPQEIRARAYELYLERSGAPGDAMGDWLCAERELTAAYEQAMKAASERRARARRGAGNTADGLMAAR